MTFIRKAHHFVVAMILTTSCLVRAEPSVKITEQAEAPYRFEPFDAAQNERITKLVSGAIDWAKKSFATDLDESDASIAKVEEILATLHSSYIVTNPRPAQDIVQNYCYAFGSYVGHVFQKNHGGVWGKAFGKERSDVEVAVQGSGTKKVTLLPWRRVCSRITEGPTMNVYEYYQVAISISQAR